MVYRRAGINTPLILMDGEFEKIKKHRVAEMAEINCTAKNEHVAEIERKIREVKERTRGTTSGLPFQHLPNIMIKGMVKFELLWLNAITPADGWSRELSPREMVLRWQLDVSVHCKADFGSYCLAYDEPIPTNTQAPRARDCICLGPTGNRQGSYRFLDLCSKRVIKRKQFKELPMPDSIIKAVDKMGRKDKQGGRLKFADRRNVEYSWSKEDEALIEDNAPEAPEVHPAIPAELPGVDLEENIAAMEAPEGDEPAAHDQTQEIRAAVENANFGPQEEEMARRAGVEQDFTPERNVSVTINVARDQGARAEEEGVDDAGDEQLEENPAYWTEDEEGSDYYPEEEELLAEEDEEEEEDGEPSVDEGDDSSEEGEETVPAANDERGRYEESRVHGARSRGARQPRAPARLNMMGAGDGTSADPRSAEGRLPHGTRVPRSFPQVAVDALVAKAAGHQECEPSIVVEGDELAVFGVILQQVSLKQGIRMWGDEAKASATKEMRQMHDLEAFIPRDPKSLTREERLKALRTLIFLKEKNDKSIKSRCCMDGSPQREYIPKEDAASPTAARDAIFIQSAIDAAERRNVGYADMPGAFLHTLTDEKVIVLLTGELCELMVAIDPKMYRKYVMTGRSGKPMLYVQLYKSVYGLLRSALLFYRKLKAELVEYGFKMNPYDPCTANMDTPSGQLTVQWHVDDVRASCKDKFEVTKLFAYLNKIYGKKVVAHRGKKADYLGMSFDYSMDGAVLVDMIQYIGKIFEEFPEALVRTSPTPAADHLFNIRDEEDARYLPEEQAQQFHRSVAQLLFLSTRARPDIATAVSFLTSRVKRPDEDDWGKLRRVLQYLKGTRQLKLCLRVTNLEEAHWFVDASHAVHWDCKGQTGASMTLGKGAVINSSLRQKINTKSSCETELVGVDDVISTVLWSLYFIEAQGHDIKRARIFQDNKSAILLEKNGRMSSSKRTKHFKNKIFFVHDRVEHGEVAIEYCPTKQMWTDANTKPKQGTPFRLDRSKMLNCPLNPSQMELTGEGGIAPQ